MTFCCSSDSLGFRLSFSASSSLRFRIISRFLCTSSSVRMTAGMEGKSEGSQTGTGKAAPKRLGCAAAKQHPSALLMGH